MVWLLVVVSTVVVALALNNGDYGLVVLIFWLLWGVRLAVLWQRDHNRRHK